MLESVGSQVLSTVGVNQVNPQRQNDAASAAQFLYRADTVTVYSFYLKQSFQKIKLDIIF